MLLVAVSHLGARSAPGQDHCCFCRSRRFLAVGEGLADALQKAPRPEAHQDYGDDDFCYDLKGPTLQMIIIHEIDVDDRSGCGP